MVDLIETFWNDGKVDVLVVMIALDFFLGVFAALRNRAFRLAYVADFLRKDVIFKMGGYLVLYAGAHFAGEADIVIDGLDLGVVAGAAYVVVVAALVGSIVNSVRELGIWPRADAKREVPPQRDVLDMVSADEGI